MRLKAWLEQNFYIPKHAHIPERTLFVRIGLSVGVMLVSLAAMSFSAFAFFNHGVSSARTAITSATFELEVASAEASGNGGYFLLENATGESVDYTFTLSVSPDTTATVGYCKIAIQTDYATDGRVTLQDGTVAENVQFFYTQPLWLTAAEGKPSSREVKLTLPAGKSLGIRFLAEWGSCACDDIVQTTIDGILFAPVTPPENGGEGGEGNGEGDPPAEPPSTLNEGAPTDETTSTDEGVTDDGNAASTPVSDPAESQPAAESE